MYYTHSFVPHPFWGQTFQRNTTFLWKLKPPISKRSSISFSNNGQCIWLLLLWMPITMLIFAWFIWNFTCGCLIWWQICIHKISEAYPLPVHGELFITELFECPSYIFGDFNIDFKPSHPLYKSYKQVLSIFDLSKVINKPTRITESLETIIDHKVTNRKEHLAKYGVIPMGLSDHMRIYCSRRGIFGTVVLRRFDPLRTTPHRFSTINSVTLTGNHVFVWVRRWCMDVVQINFPKQHWTKWLQ